MMTAVCSFRAGDLFATQGGGRGSFLLRAPWPGLKRKGKGKVAHYYLFLTILYNLLPT